MIGEFVVALFAGIVNPTAPHLDRNDVIWTVIVLAPGLGIKFQPTYLARF
jgi:hypothetical protein